MNITFGSGSGQGPALAAGITNLAYISACPSDGQYTIVNYTSGCSGATWLTIPHDHTGDAGGYFMLVNASYQPSDFYVQTVSGLCGGTTYQFGAWVMNVAVSLSQIKPNITFKIEKTDGTVLQSYSTGDIAALGYTQWNQYTFNFDTPPGISSVVIRMTNNAPGGIGNDLALDDITFRASGPSIQTAVAGFTGASIDLCSNDLQTLHFSSTVESCFTSAVYQWQVSMDGGVSWSDIAGAVGLSYDRGASGSGAFLYRMTVAESGNAGISTCSVASTPVRVNVIPLPSPAVTISGSPDPVCEGAPVVFHAAVTDGGSAPLLQWSVNGGNAGIASGVDSLLLAGGLADGNVVRCVLTSNAACVVNPMVVSNAVSLSVVPIPVTAVSIAASASSVCADSLVVFTATPFNGGLSPSFTWMVNGVVSGSSPVFSTRGLADGDRVSCVMNGSLLCSLPALAPSAIQMTIYPLPTIELVSDTVIAGGASLLLTPVIGGDVVSYQWSPSVWIDDVTIARPVVRPESTMTYQLAVFTAEGCRAVGSEKVAVFYAVSMPGAFTPNGDGHNDVFRVPPSIVVNIRGLAVYNRLGARLFFSSSAAQGWDGTFGGKTQPAGTYVWVVEYDDPLTKRVESKKGTVVLIR